MGRRAWALLLVGAAVSACGSGAPGQSGSGGTGAVCTKDADCGDGICRPDGTCGDGHPVTPQASQCANVSCPAGQFCANGKCLAATAQCKAADPACIFIPHGAFEPPVHAWWWPYETPLGPDEPGWYAGKYRKDLEYPEFIQVMSTPVVMRLHAGDAEPAVVFNSFPDPTRSTESALESRGVMRAIRGSDGAPLWSAPKDFWNNLNVIGAVDGNSSVAAGDCKGDGHVCFITGGWSPDDVNTTNFALSHQHGGLIAFDENGDLLWRNQGNPATGEPGPSVWWGGPAIARLLPDSKSAQVVVGDGVYDAATGKTLCAQTREPTDQISGNGIGSLSIIADIDLDGVPEILTGNNAYKLEKDPASATGYRCRALFGLGVRTPYKPPFCPYGQTKSTRTGQQVCICPGGFEDICPDGFTAVANFAGYGAKMGLKPDDKHPQVVVVSHGFLRIHDWTGGMVLNPIPLPSERNPDCVGQNNAGGPPTIADFDGDGLPEIGIAAQGGYVVWKPGTQAFMWKTKTFDCSAATGSSVFDFEGKGQANVVYSDQCYFRIYDGKTGATLVQEKNSSCTAYETPVVADIDGSGRAKILVPNSGGQMCDYRCPDWPGGPGSTQSANYFGLKALASPSDKWVNTRSVWNQHSYHVTNVNLDGTLPFPEPNSWDPGQSNSYRQNVQGQGIFSSPDLSICEVTPDLTNCNAGGASVSATVYNGGALLARPGVPVNFYAELAGGSVLIGTTTTKGSLKPGDSEKVSVPWRAPPASTAVPVRAVVDPNQQIGDCHPENNSASSAPAKCPPIG